MIAVSPVAAVLQASTPLMATLAARVQPETIVWFHHQLVTILVQLERTVKQAQRIVIRDISTPTTVNLVGMRVQQGPTVHRMECYLRSCVQLEITALATECHLTTHAPLDRIAQMAIRNFFLPARMIYTAQVLKLFLTMHAPMDPTASILSSALVLRAPTTLINKP